VEEDVLNRAGSVKDEIEFVFRRQNESGFWSIWPAQKGELPCTGHPNDTKLNNVLMDKKTRKGICAVDLDTVMPGLSLYDFGDAIRFGANTAAEDEKDLSKVWMEESLFEAYAKGYLQEAGSSLTDKEIELLPAGAKLMTFECGMRFLTIICRENLFKIHMRITSRRCRTQFSSFRTWKRSGMHACNRQ
jgi:hypothetical protein